MGRVRVTVHNGNLALDTPFDRGFLNELKMRVPSTDRVWSDKHSIPKNTWLVHPKHARTVHQLILDHYGEDVKIPDIKQTVSKQTGKVSLYYLGTAKDKNDGYAYGMDFKHEWTILIHEDVLRAWFSGAPEIKIKKSQQVPATYFEKLGIKKSATEEEIKKGYRRMAMQWHPDHCKEPNARDKFEEIQAAYDTLIDPKKRKIYIFGLAQEQEYAVTKEKQDTWTKALSMDTTYVPNLRCGVLMAEYTEELGRKVITKILSWDDVVNTKGEILVTSWAAGDSRPMEDWVNPNVYTW